MVQPLWRTVCRSFNQSNIASPYDPAIPFPGAQPRELDTYAHIKTYVRMFKAARVTIAIK